MAPTLIITNDFPPTIGGIEGFVADLCRLLDSDVVVVTRHTPGWQEADRRLDFPVLRTGRLLLPTPAVARRATAVITRYGIDTVIFGAMAPLALLAPALRAAGVRRMLAISHGHETWWAALPGSRRLLHRMGRDVDHVGYISDYTRARIGPALPPAARDRMLRIPPPVDAARFTPAPDGLRLDQAPDLPPDRVRRCIAVGRMVRQKGFDTLIRAWARLADHDHREQDHDHQLHDHQFHDRRPGEHRPGDHRRELVLVGDGPQAARLRRLAADLGVADTVRFTGPLDRDRVAAELRAATVFALPVRSRLGGLNPEGLGLGFLEAAASGLPVIAGRSGGAPETVLDGRTGFVVDPDDADRLADRIEVLLDDPQRAAAMGHAGRAYVVDRYGDQVVRDALRQALGA